MKDYTIVEPSAGNGSFSDILFERFEDVVALDISPDNDTITELDYFNFKPEENKKYLVIGNPPFGRVSSLAYKFLEHSMTYADYVCFLIPRTFKRHSFMKKINFDFHLLYQEDLPIGVFIPKTMSAKTVFQVWERREYKRTMPTLRDKTDDFKIIHLNDREQSDFAIRAYGGNCGQFSDDISNLAPRSWHFIKCVKENKEELKKRFASLDLEFAKDTVRQDSVGAMELIDAYNKKFY